MRTEFLEDYKKNCITKTELVPGMDFLLSELENMSIQWGVVTNKHYKFASKIIEGLSIKNRSSCLITGNMVNNPKPSPEMLLKAKDLLRLDVNNIMYIGDDERDIIAGKSAGMKTATANFGFIKNDINYSSWNSDYIINKPQDLLDILKKL
jgi:phosphoglycolate phosphatase